MLLMIPGIIIAVVGIFPFGIVIIIIIIINILIIVVVA